MINAAITPGIQPARVSKKTISIEPHPLSITDKGGNKIASITLSSDILLVLMTYCCKDKKIILYDN